jgi:C-terminal processing protease CtpA/Prc
LRARYQRQDRPRLGKTSVASDADPIAEERELKTVNYELREVRILPGNIGYFRLDAFAPAQAGGRTAIAAMRFVSGTDALIFDLRRNSGGEPSRVQLLSSFLVREPTHLNDSITARGIVGNSPGLSPTTTERRGPTCPSTA